MSFWASRLSRRSLCSTGPGGSSIAPRGLTQTVSLRPFLAPSSAHWQQAKTRGPLHPSVLPLCLCTLLSSGISAFSRSRDEPGSVASRGGSIGGEVTGGQDRIDVDAHGIFDAPG